MQLLKNTALRFMVSGYFPLDNCSLENCPPLNPSRAIDPQNLHPGKLPLDISPWTYTPRATSPYKIPLNKITLRTFALWIITPDGKLLLNSFSHGQLPPGQVTPMKLPPRQFTPGLLTSNGILRWKITPE